MCSFITGILVSVFYGLPSLRVLASPLLHLSEAEAAPLTLAEVFFCTVRAKLRSNNQPVGFGGVGGWEGGEGAQV